MEFFFGVSKFNMQGKSYVFEYLLHSNTKVLPHAKNCE